MLRTRASAPGPGNAVLMIADLVLVDPNLVAQRARPCILAHGGSATVGPLDALNTQHIQTRAPPPTPYCAKNTIRYPATVTAGCRLTAACVSPGWRYGWRSRLPRSVTASRHTQNMSG